MLKEALGEGLTPYNLRHTFASLCAETVRPDIVGVWMGDSAENLVGKVYVHFKDEFKIHNLTLHPKAHPNPIEKQK